MRRFVLSLAFCYFVLVFFSPFSIVITSLGEQRVNLVLFVRLFDLRLFGFVCFLFLLVSGKGCCLYLWHSLDFSLTFFVYACCDKNMETFTAMILCIRSLLQLIIVDIINSILYQVSSTRIMATL